MRQQMSKPPMIDPVKKNTRSPVRQDPSTHRVGKAAREHPHKKKNRAVRNRWRKLPHEAGGAAQH
ncbi:MAG: hypothetical protein ACK55Z_05655, partial [bacterium]